MKYWKGLLEQRPQAGWEWMGSLGKLIWFFCKLRMPHLPPSLLYIKKENKSLAMSGFSIYLTLYDCMSRKLHSSQMERMRCEENIKIRKQSGKQKAASNGSLAETVTVNSLFHESRAKETWFSQSFVLCTLSAFPASSTSYCPSTPTCCFGIVAGPALMDQTSHGHNRPCNICYIFLGGGTK